MDARSSELDEELIASVEAYQAIWTAKIASPAESFRWGFLVAGEGRAMAEGNSKAKEERAAAREHFRRIGLPIRCMGCATDYRTNVLACPKCGRERDKTNAEIEMYGNG